MCRAINISLLVLLSLSGLCLSSPVHPKQQLLNNQFSSSSSPSLQPISPSIIPPDLFSDLQELALLVDISYCVGTPATGIQAPFSCLSHCSHFPSFQLIHTWNTGPLLSDSCGYIALSHPPAPKRIIVAFRGTYSLTNAVVDLSSSQQEYVPYPSKAGDDDDDVNRHDENDNDNDNQRQNTCTNCTAHKGFLESWQTTRPAILPQLLRLMATYGQQSYNLHLVGHSLGGSIAALAGLEFHARGWNPTVTTFGEPRVGNKELARYIDDRFSSNDNDDNDKYHDDHNNNNNENNHSSKSKGNSNNNENNKNKHPKYRRITHINDPVPSLPFSTWGFQQHETEYFIGKKDLPITRADVKQCLGDQDESCAVGNNDNDDTGSGGGGGGGIGHGIGRGIGRRIGRGVRVQPAGWQSFFGHRDYFIRMGVCMPEYS